MIRYLPKYIDAWEKLLHKEIIEARKEQIVAGIKVYRKLLKEVEEQRFSWDDVLLWVITAR